MKSLNKPLDKSPIQNYQPQTIQLRWQEKWEEWGVYQPNLDTAKKPFFNLMMFPYPSAEGLHVGNLYAFTGSDIYGRFKRMQGYNVFEPFGLDGFGIHSENYALKAGRHPKQQAAISQEHFYDQMRMTGIGIDWSRKLESYDPRYYKWTQWLFTELFKAGLAYRKKQAVNYCPGCKTVIADEQVIAGECERCGSLVEQRELEQWFFRITAYAKQLLENIENLDWSEKVKIAQTNWIGKSEGALIKFLIDGSGLSVKAFTTRPDTLFGVTFLVVSPEHPLTKKMQKNEVIEYLNSVKTKSTEERLSNDKEKQGVFSGLYATHPLTNERVPIWVADYVLMDYGTGAIMAVPAHDKRDYDFATKYNLPIKSVIEQPDNVTNEFHPGSGTLINSGEWDNWQMPQDIDKVINWLENKGIASKNVNYHLRDWLISRQRYWGPPIPMIYCKNCANKGKSWFSEHSEKKPEDWNTDGWYPVEVASLPVLLPDVEEWKPMGTGKAPLANFPEFYKTTCPSCKGEAVRETDVSDNFLDSSWYFFRYTSTELDNEAFSNERVAKWLPVDMYIGGAEHSLLHLLYTRFVTHFLAKRGFIDFTEPFSRFYAHGLIIKEGAKMSKSKGNVVVPDLYINKYGADTLRSYLMFLGPFSQGGDFRDSGIEGMDRFLKRVWKLVQETKVKAGKIDKEDKLDKFMHKTIKEVTLDMENLRYNTALAHLMEYYNELHSHKQSISPVHLKTFVLLIAPFAPHMGEELWQFLNDRQIEDIGAQDSVHVQKWPDFDESKLKMDVKNIVVQFNGKTRGLLTLAVSKINSQKDVEQAVKSDSRLNRYLENKDIKKVIYVEGRLINFVI